MKKFTKQDLMMSLKENNIELDELADYKKQKGIEKGWEPIMNEPQDDEGSYKAVGGAFLGGKSKGKLIGHKIIDKTTEEPLVVFYPCDKNVDEFIAENSDAIQSLTKEYGDFYISKSNTIPKCKPRTTAGDKTLYRPSGEAVKVDTRVRFEKELSDAAYLKRYLIYPVVEDIFGNDVNQHLNKCGIPIIKVNERAHLDRHSKFTNSVLTYQTMNLNSYKDVRDFLSSSIRRVKGQETEEEKGFREYHLSRQFNNVYQKWDKYKKTDEKNFGFTPIYNLEKYGFSPTTFDVTVWSLFTITGRLIYAGTDVSFEWNVTFKTEHGKVLKDSNALRKLNLNRDYEFNKSVQVDLTDSLNGDVNKKDSIAKNEDVINSFRDVLTQIKEEILSIPVQEQLKRAKVSSFQLSQEEKEELRRKRQERTQIPNENEPEPQIGGEPQGEMNESLINDIVKNVLFELKK
jgi:hypothetical protein